MSVFVWNLQRIYIFKNPVVYVHPAAFKGLKMLKALTINSPLLNRAPSLEFIGHSLTRLDLSYCMARFETDYFKHGYKIRHLIVPKNGLMEIPVSLRVVVNSLIFLQLAKNNITTLEPFYGVRFVQLADIYLDGNKISTLVPNALLLPRLRALSLNDNHLHQITDLSEAPWGVDIFDEVYVYLLGNPWHCNASMEWLLQALHRYEFGHVTFRRTRSRVTLDSLQLWYCATPLEYQGRKVINVLSPKPTLKNQGRKIDWCIVW